MTGRRATLRLCVTVALVLLGGCLLPGPAAQEETTGESNASATATATVPPATTDPAATSSPTQTPTTVTPGLAVPAEDRLVLNATGPLNLTVTMYETRNATTPVANASYAFSEAQVVHVTAFEPNGWIVLRMDGEQIWADYVNSAEHYEVDVPPDGTAETASYYVK